MEEIVKVEPVEALNVRQQNGNGVNWDAISNITSQVVGLANSVVDARKLRIESERELQKINAQVEMFIGTLDDKQKDRQLKKEQVANLHDQISKLIQAATTLSVMPNLTDNQMLLIQRFLDSVDNLSSKLPQI